MEDLSLLIHAGYHKTASSWFQEEFFDKHDGFERAADGLELSRMIVRPDAFQFEVEKVRNTLLPRIKNIRSQGKTPVLSSERFTGNPHSGGYDVDRIVDRLGQLFPGSKIWYNVREQSSIITSCYKQYVKIGGVATLEQYIEGPKEHARFPWFRLQNFKYHILLKYFEHTFGGQNVLVTPYEMFTQDRSLFFEKMSHFLGYDIETDQVSTGNEKNKSMSELATIVMRTFNGIFQSPQINNYTIIPKPFPKKGRKAIRKTLWLLDNYTTKNINSSPIKKRVKKKTSGCFSESNRKLQGMGVESLSKYGYEIE
jgi:hypothetical protein